MENQISGDNSSVAVTDTPATGHVAATDGTSAANGHPAGQSGHVDDLFEGIDPKKLPPELRPHLDSMVRTYREKTEKLSERVKSETQKAVEAYRQKADWYDAALQDPDLVKTINEYVQKLQAPAPKTESSLPPELEQRLEKVDRLELQVRTAEMKTHIDAFEGAKDQKGNLLHPDFEKLASFSIGTHGQAGEYNLLRTAIELAPGASPHEKLENGYKAAKVVYDKIFEEGKKAGMGRLQSKAQNGTLPPSGALSVAGVAPHRAKNALEALQFARQGLSPSQE